MQAAEKQASEFMTVRNENVERTQQEFAEHEL